jgi:hypothetical protein
MAENLQITYKATPTMVLFHNSTAFYRGVRGPVRSGKSTGMCHEIWKRILEQAPAKDKIRYTKWVVIRNTYGELLDTTIPTWLRYFPESQCGPLNKQRMEQHIRRVGPKGGIDVMVLFRAMDRPDDAKHLGSLEVTGAWVNEAKDVPKVVIDTLGDRVGQFPPKELGGCTWRGVLLDTNSMDTDHWWYRMAEEERPPGWAFFSQPGGLVESNGKFYPNPRAENVNNLNEPDYYLARMAGKKIDHVRVFYCNQYGFVQEGKPVFGEYTDAIHCSREVLQPVKGIPIRVGIDWGLTPSVTFGQRLPNGRWVILSEIVSERMGAQNLAIEFYRHINEMYPGFEIIAPSGDPAGEAGAQTDEKTPFQVFNTELANLGLLLEAIPAPTNDPVLRQGAVRNNLSRLIDGVPALVISPACRVLRKGFMGGYCLKRIQVSGDERFKDAPDKNRFSHVQDSLQYLLCGAGEGRALIESKTSVVQKAVDLVALLSGGSSATSAWG